MRIIITGGTGLIGRALTDNLASEDHEVIILSRAPARATGLPAGVHVERWDARTAKGWSHLAEGADAIVNLAGASLTGEGFLPSRWTAERKRLIRDSRVNAGRAVVQAVEQVSEKPRVVIQASGVGYYGPRGDEELAEDASPGNDFLAHIAHDGWEPSTAPVETLGVRRVIVRSGPVLSIGGGALPRMMLPFRLFVGGPMGSGRQWFSWIHMADQVAAIRFLIENNATSGPFNFVAPHPVTNAEFSRALGRAMGRPSLVPVPAFAMRLAFGEVASVLLEGQRAFPKRLLELGFTFRFPDAESALRDLLK
jgi:uncharacterized protein (TIGR01777 family)